ncbi:hypothetical protein KRM19_21980, partial [Xanthomonas hortorum pv. gardneri]
PGARVQHSCHSSRITGHAIGKTVSAQFLGVAVPAGASIGALGKLPSDHGCNNAQHKRTQGLRVGDPAAMTAVLHACARIEDGGELGAEAKRRIAFARDSSTRTNSRSAR